MQCKVVVEGANGPTDLDGEKALLARGIDVVPDILANSGGVIVSYYEWLQNKRSESWELEEVQMRLERRMRRSYQTVADRMRELKTDMRTTCYAIALEIGGSIRTLDDNLAAHLLRFISADLQLERSGHEDVGFGSKKFFA